ncbi:MAG: DUF2520 domain-containing protein, partial [Muribaculaceae bacterium]|nr:DUF2520 domain-containing protein [Muribaculaceae bacterium]
IGRGNVASHLRKALEPFCRVVMVNPHNLEGLDMEADITLISVSDSAIPEVLGKLPKMNGIVSHTSGSTPINVFENSGSKNYGVFYPLQTFSKDKDLHYDQIPFYIEGSEKGVEEILSELARLISPHVRYADSAQRKSVHIASVFSCNFVNHLWALSAGFLEENGLSFNDLLPLIEETFNKIKVLPPYDAQTGPAVRGDRNIINNHLQQLSENKEMLKIYEELSDSILRSHNKLNT